MVVQGQIKETMSSIAIVANNHQSDGGSEPEPVFLVRTTSIENESCPKARKPYTISKQREKWTDEEHHRFLEALKLYGRGWRQIQEHVRTKTAVQIRSHAQKFFSKVVRESSGSEENLTNPIEIPPPRPKKKPLHPYPRKQLDSLNIKLVPKEEQRSPSPNLAVADKEIQSPTILTAFGSEEIGSAGSELSNGCVSPTSCTSHVHSIALSTAKKECDYVASGSSGEEAKESILSLNLSMEVTSAFENNQSVKDDSAIGSSVKSIKLFGSTVFITNSKHPSSQASPTSTICQDDYYENRFQTSPSSQFVNWNLVPFVAPINIGGYEQSNFYPVESGSNRSLPLWSLCHGLPYYKTACDQISVQPCPNSQPEVTVKEESPKERSCTSSNSGSDEEAVESQWQATRAERKIINTQNSNKGFVPYKRCLEERERSAREKQKSRVC